ncbi:MAG: DoxX family membrane protein [Planctomycetales bacterium]
MKIANVVARSLLGVVFVVFGLNGFLQFIKLPPLPGPAVRFLLAMNDTGYLLPLVMGTELVCGALLLSGYFVPLALTVLTPILVNIVCFHLYLTSRNNLLPATGLLAMHLFLMWQYRRSYKGLFASKGAAS